jgi:hypothetical protein
MEQLPTMLLHWQVTFLAVSVGFVLYTGIFWTQIIDSQEQREDREVELLNYERRLVYVWVWVGKNSSSGLFDGICIQRSKQQRRIAEGKNARCHS